MRGEESKCKLSICHMNKSIWKVLFLLSGCVVFRTPRVSSQNLHPQKCAVKLMWIKDLHSHRCNPKYKHCNVSFILATRAWKTITKTYFRASCARKNKSLSLFVTCCRDVALKDRRWIEPRMNNKMSLFLTCERKADIYGPTANVNQRLDWRASFIKTVYWEVQTEGYNSRVAVL